jgi:hypothetical protein
MPDLPYPHWPPVPRMALLRPGLATHPHPLASRGLGVGARVPAMWGDYGAAMS